MTFSVSFPWSVFGDSFSSVSFGSVVVFLLTFWSVGLLVTVLFGDFGFSVVFFVFFVFFAFFFFLFGFSSMTNLSSSESENTSGNSV